LQSNQHIFTNLIGFFKKYIEKITELSKDVNSKYRNIEIITYENENIYSKLKSDSTKNIAGHIETFGTIMRLHPLISEDVDFCIMRNCSNSFTPLDIKIQDYWINEHERTEILMDYFIPTYGFTLDSINNKIMTNNEIKIRRLPGGLTSYRNNNSQIRDILINNINSISKQMDEIQKSTNNIKHGTYKYGIDEIILSKIFNDSSFTSFHIKLSKTTTIQDSIYSKYNIIANQYIQEHRYMSVNDKTSIDKILIDNISIGSILRCIEFKKFPRFLFSEDDKKKITTVEGYYMHTDLKIFSNVDISSGIDNYEKAFSQFQTIFNEENIYPILFLPSEIIVYLKDNYEENENNKEISKDITQKITSKEMQTLPEPKQESLLRLKNLGNPQLRKLQRQKKKLPPPQEAQQAAQQAAPPQQLTGGNKYIKKTIKYKTNKKHKSHSQKYKNKKH
jgi:hypothetical protein